jgi:RNA polymerase sigma factor (TIGR02999 family)
MDAPHTQHEVTRLLFALRDGEKDAAERLARVVYDELHAIAEHAMRRESGGHTLQPTILVHEAFLRLIDQQEVNWQGRAHFFALAAQAIRRILVDHARRRQAVKRDGGARITLEDAALEASTDSIDLIAIDDALQRLATLDERQARVVELRFFTGLGVKETAEALGISPATVKRDWTFAKAFLQRELEGRGRAVEP